MTLSDKIRNVVGLGKDEYVVQLYDGESRRWIDEGMSDDVTEPEEYGFDESDTDKRRKIHRKGSKLKDIMWTVGGKKKKRARKTKELGSKDKSPIDAISMQAQKIKKDQEKLVEIRDVIGELLGSSESSDRDEEWKYPGMAKGLNMGLGHAFMTGMDSKKDEIASAGLEMVQGISNIMSAVPIIAVAYAKSQGVNVGIFGIDEKEIFGRGNGNGKKATEAPPAKQSEIIHEHDGGFDVNTSDDSDDDIGDENGYGEGPFEEEIDSGCVCDEDELLLDGEFDEEELEKEITLLDDDEVKPSMMSNDHPLMSTTNGLNVGDDQ